MKKTEKKIEKKVKDNSFEDIVDGFVEELSDNEEDRADFRRLIGEFGEDVLKEIFGVAKMLRDNEIILP